MKKLKPWETAALVVVGGVLLGWIASILTGCASPTEYAVKINPATGEGTATATKAALITPLGGFKVAEATVQPLPEGMGLLEIAGLALGGTGLLTSLFPKGRDIWSMLFTKGVPTSQKLQGLAALPFPVINNPPAAHAIRKAKRDAVAKAKKENPA